MAFIHVIKQNYPSRVVDIPEAQVLIICLAVKIEPRQDSFTLVLNVLVKDCLIAVP